LFFPLIPPLFTLFLSPPFVSWLMACFFSFIFNRPCYLGQTNTIPLLFTFPLHFPPPLSFLCTFFFFHCNGMELLIVNAWWVSAAIIAFFVFSFSSPFCAGHFVMGGFLAFVACGRRQCTNSLLIVTLLALGGFSSVFRCAGGENGLYQPDSLS